MLKDPIPDTQNLFDENLIQKRKQKAQSTLVKASYLVRDIWNRHMDTLSVVVAPDSPEVSILLLGPTLEYEHQIRNKYPNTFTTCVDPLASPDDFAKLLTDTNQKFDLVLDTFGFHWINDPLMYLVKLRALMKPNGFYACGFLGGTTLQELRQTLIETDLKLFDGAFARCSPMIKPEATTRIIQSAGFLDSVVEHEEVLVEYPTFTDVVKDLRLMGESNAMVDRASHLGKSLTAKSGFSKTYASESQSTYQRLFPSNKVSITYDIVYMSGWNE